jgi:hypothetical protein
MTDEAIPLLTANQKIYFQVNVLTHFYIGRPDPIVN